MSKFKTSNSSRDIIFNKHRLYRSNVLHCFADRILPTNNFTSQVTFNFVPTTAVTYAIFIWNDYAKSLSGMIMRKASTRINFLSTSFLD